MPTDHELSAAVERLRRCRGGNKQTLCDVYQESNVFDAQERYSEDESLVADAYIAHSGNTDVSDKCRAMFEQWCDNNGVFRARQPSGFSEFGVPFNPDKYRMASVQLAWEAWQAAWTASREEAAKELAGDTVIVPVNYVDGGAMLLPKLAEDSHAD